ncbi:hypothetical protein [Kribbella sp. NPDC051718]|uniref:hypothetical protein n=1 Tax=Kribbella sp. NPDC051718 TaxID=3155168 RepID=UPI00342029CE
MAFPADDRDVLVEMKIGPTTWTDITADVYTRDLIEITRGRNDEGAEAAPSFCRFSVDNTGGKYSLRNPLSTLYGKIGRNTQVRVSLQTDPVYDAYSNASGTGDLSWTHTPVGNPTGVCVFIWQYNTASGQVASVTYGGVTMERKIFGLFALGATNMVGYCYWLNTNIPDGPQTIVVDTTATILRQASAVSVTGGSNAEMDNSGFANSGGSASANPGMALLTFKRTRLFGSMFSELDDGSTISAGTGYVELGEHDIGTETVSVERSAVLPAGNYAIGWNAASAHWGIMTVAIRTVYYRSTTEIPALPPRWNDTGTDPSIPIESAGLLRRLGQGTDPAQTGLRDYILSQPQSLTSYYPLSGAEGTKESINLGSTWKGSTRFSGVKDPGPGPVFTYGVDMGSYLGTGMELNATGNTSYMFGQVGTGEPSGAAFDFVWQSPAMGVLTAEIQDYNLNRWSVTLNTSSDDCTAQVSFIDPNVGPIGFAATAFLPELQNTDVHHCRLQVIVVGADTNYTLYIDGVSVKTGTMAGYKWLGTSVFRLYYTRYVNQTVMNIAHITVWSENNPAVIPSAAALTAAAKGYAGETAGDRLLRISSVGAIPLTIVGDPADTTVMGPQYSESKLTQLRDVESTDLGILAEPRDQLALTYRTRASMYAQAPKVTLDMSAGQVSAPFEPTDDDTYTRNDVTAVRREGDSYRIIQTVGKLSISDPPNGVGRYKDEVTVNVQTDAQLPGFASWLMNAGTLDQARYPSITVDLAKSSIVDAGLEAAILALDYGDRILLSNASFLNIYDDISLIVLGYTETIGPHEHKIRFKCMPEAAYAVAVYGTSPTVGTDHYDTNGSALAAGVNSTATSLSVKDTGGTLWTTDASAFPFDIQVGGERITVQNITGTSSPQTFSPVIRSVNGVVKSHLTDADVRLFRTPRYAL